MRVYLERSADKFDGLGSRLDSVCSIRHSICTTYVALHSLHSGDHEVEWGWILLARCSLTLYHSDSLRLHGATNNISPSQFYCIVTNNKTISARDS
ncbi:hypothetical protein WOLCODRAFT_139088 [Wolfiporia cocos MD-104 SS10]|uniref:Uncharacterized protein n=1 Tax=Wolfiporia cocos (strain MD-104) TaxID=742152 RepID=A0A2H3K820_WOLCO|nr:hypothetical protein WOLCODRAFT_139088 [Wolfiporia cocos MD-104 SS10]